uniref:Potassium transporter n=1 Tax=Phaffia rhodozyma TaxID=264483 RepID=A0A1C9U699_PHARH|nr:potassium transporter [Phaffia rhodozyma]
MFFVRTGDYDALAGVLLCITGCEGMFANLGQFNAPSIRIGFVYAYICLVLAYLGQGAKIITDGPNVIPNIFYNSIPGGTGSGVFWLLWIFGLFATLIASQTLITASFSLTQQLISMEALPRLRMKYTSEAFKGQIYFASVNYILMIAVVGAVAGFGTDASLTNAYGFAVSTVMFVTTTLIALQIPFVKNKSWLLAIPFLIFFGFIEGLFWGASLRKVPHGAWFPLSVGVALTILMTFYSWGRSLEKSFDKSHTSRLHDIIFRRHRVASSHEGRAHARFEITQIPACDDEKDQQTNPVELREEIVELPREKRPGNPSVSIEKKALKTPMEDKVELGEQLFLNVRETYLELPRVPTCAIFHKTSNTSKGIPHTFYQFLKGWPALPRVVIFASTEVTNAPHVALEDRYIITKVRSFEGIYGLTVRTGYRDQSRTNMADVVPYLIQAERQFDPKISFEKIKEIEQAAANTTQIMPSYVLLSQKTRWASWGYIRKMLVEELYARLRVMFPDQEIQTDKGDGEAIHIGVTAHI